MFILGFKYTKEKLREVGRKAKLEERKNLDAYYQSEISNLRRSNLNEIEKVIKQYEKDKKEALDDLSVSLKQKHSETLKNQKNAYNKALREKDKEIEDLKKERKELKRKLTIADKKLQKSQKAYRRYREYSFQALRYSSRLADEVKEIFSVSGELFQRFVSIRDKVEHIDNTNQKYEKYLMELLDMDESDLLLCLQEPEDKQLEYNSDEGENDD